MARKNYNLDEMKKKPSALLVYLTLVQNRGNGPMGRQDIIDYIDKHFGILIQPKTVSESVAILKAMSEMHPPLVDFQPNGKKGYQLGRSESVFSLGEMLRIIECLSTVQAEAEVWKSIESLMKQEDIDTLKTIRGSLVHPKVFSEAKEEQKYFEKIGVIAHAIESKREIIFNHVFSDGENNQIKTEFEVRISPYYLFAKNGRFYLLGGRLGDARRGIHHSLYIADIANIERVKISRDSIVPWSYSFRPESIAKQVFPYPFIKEGEFHHNDYRFKIHVASKSVLLEINALFGNCYRIIQRLRRKHGDHFEQEYVIEFFGNHKSAFMLQMRFPTLIRILDLPEVYRKDLVDRANMIAKGYSAENYAKLPSLGAPKASALEAKHRQVKKAEREGK